MAKFLACYLGSPPTGGPPSQETIQRGMAAWHKWMADNAGIVIDSGGPLGKTKKIGPEGVSDSRNALTGYVIIEAEDHESAARLFLDHPHFAIFPGDSVEVMPVLPTPGS